MQTWREESPGNQSTQIWGGPQSTGMPPPPPPPRERDDFQPSPPREATQSTYGYPAQQQTVQSQELYSAPATVQPQDVYSAPATLYSSGQQIVQPQDLHGTVEQLHRLLAATKEELANANEENLNLTEAVTVIRTEKDDKIAKLQQENVSLKATVADLTAQLAEQAVAPSSVEASGTLEVKWEVLKGYAADFPASNLLGEGGQGGVFRGTMPGGVAVAIKRIPVHEMMGDAGFTQELAALRAVQHQNVIKLLAYNETGDPDGCSYLVMPLKKADLGAILRDRPRNRLGLDWAQRCSALLDSLRGLEALHDNSMLQSVPTCSIELTT